MWGHFQDPHITELYRSLEFAGGFQRDAMASHPSNVSLHLVDSVCGDFVSSPMQESWR